MNYKKIHDQIISKRQSEEFIGYGEKHHIIPKSMGGNDSKSNLVRLTAREHFIIHWLLKKIYENKQMTYAFFAMTKMGNKSQKRYSSKSFQYAREAMSKYLSTTRSGHNHPMFGLNGNKNPNFGSKRSNEVRVKLSEAAKKRTSQNGKSRKVMRIETGTVYNSLSEAGRHNKGNIFYAITEGGTANGYHFNYLDESGKAIMPNCNLKGYAKGGKNPNSIKIVNSSTGEIFNTITLAAKSLGVTGSAISWCIKNNKACQGNYFEKV